jgi:transcriptional regulator with XRE-family HTH domain
MSSTHPLSEYEVRALLKRLGITQKHIAAELDVTQGMVSYVISGHSRKGPNGQRIMRYIARGLGLPVRVVFPNISPARPFPARLAA